MRAETTHPPTNDRSVHILEAACRVIVREGAHGLRMASVAEEAGVSKALVHYYFATRQELLRNAFAFSERRWHTAVDDELARLPTGAARVERMLLVSVEPDLAFSEQRALWNEVWSSLRSDDDLRPLVERSYRAWLARIVDLIEEGRADGSVGSRGRARCRRVAARRDRGRARLAPLSRARRPRTGAGADARPPWPASSATVDRRPRARRRARRAGRRPRSRAGRRRRHRARGARPCRRTRRADPRSTTERPVQLGGEVVGSFHTAYLGLVEELGLTLQPSYIGLEGQTTYDLVEGVLRADDWPFATAAERDDYERVERLYGALAATVDPEDPWSHPDATTLDRISVGAWLRSVGALPSVVRCLEMGSLALADGSIERTSLLAELRKSAAAREEGFYGYDRWESLQVRRGKRRGGRADGLGAGRPDPLRMRRRGDLGRPHRVLGPARERRDALGRRRRLRTARRRAAAHRDRRRLARSGSRSLARPTAWHWPRRWWRSSTAPSGPTSARTASPRARE